MLRTRQNAYFKDRKGAARMRQAQEAHAEQEEQSRESSRQRDATDRDDSSR